MVPLFIIESELLESPARIAEQVLPLVVISVYASLYSFGCCLGILISTYLFSVDCCFSFVYSDLPSSPSSAFSFHLLCVSDLEFPFIYWYVHFFKHHFLSFFHTSFFSSLFIFNTAAAKILCDRSVIMDDLPLSFSESFYWFI